MTTMAYEHALAIASQRIATAPGRIDWFAWGGSLSLHRQETAFEIELRRAEYAYGLEQVPASSYRGKVRL